MLKIFPPKSKSVLSKRAPIHPHRFLQFSSSSSSPFVSSIITSILNSKTQEEALEIFHSATINPHKNLKVHSAIIHCLTEAKSYIHARCLIKDLIEELQKFRKPRRACSSVFKALSQLGSDNSTSNVYGVLIIALCEMGLIDEAYWVYQKIGTLPAMQACNAFLDGLCKRKRFDFMWEVYGDMLSLGASPSVVTYGVLIDACCDQGDIAKAEMLLDEMLGKGIQPTVVIYTTLIRGLCGEGEMLKADSTLTRMREFGVLPNLYTYNALMDGYSKMANVEKARQLY